MRKFVVAMSLVAALSTSTQAKDHWITRPNDWFGKPPFLISNPPTQFHGENQIVHNVRYSAFDYNLGGQRCAFVSAGNGRWIEIQGTNRAHFVETQRNTEFVEIFDAGRNARVRLHAGVSGINVQGRGWTQLYVGTAR